MLIIYLEKLNQFARKHAHARKSIATWVSTTENAAWRNMMDIRRTFPRAKILSEDRARFEIVHNVYRLIVRVDFPDQVVEIRFIGTHNEYDYINVFTI